MDKKIINRVDVQVTCLVVIIVAICSTLVYNTVYTINYQSMLDVLEQNAISIKNYIDDELDHSIFTQIQTEEDMTGELYEDSYDLLNEIRIISGIKYIYTATTNDDGELIYHIDGLPIDDVDFRPVGYLIEEEFQEPLLLGLQGEVIIPEDILETQWGDVYVSYFPLYGEDGQVDAVLGMEFNAGLQSDAFVRIRNLVNLLILGICFGSGVICHVLFKRISNPYFKDIYNTDSLTKLKNRNAYDTDTNNLINTNYIKDMAIVITDLNGLKLVNDRHGHKLGDSYISKCGQTLLENKPEKSIVYRIGGDEFATVIPSNDPHILDGYISDVKSGLVKLCGEEIPTASVSMGYAICIDNSKLAWERAYQEADGKMYQDKKSYYATNKGMDSRKTNT